jgi:pimeloyl-ACP methyl ester carboxylesterase
MSAKFAQYLTLVAPDRILGQILVAGCPAGEISLPPELVADWMSREGDAERMAELTASYAAKPIEPELVERFGRDAATVRRPALEGTLNACLETSFTDRLDTIATPTMVVGGSHDQIFTPDALREGVVAPLRNARLAVLDAGHELPLEVPRELAALIETFCAGLR